MSSTISQPTVRSARSSELGCTAMLHERELPAGFFARLGPRFLQRYHQTFSESPLADVLVVPNGSEPAGVLVGTYDNAAHYRWAMRHCGRMLAVAGLLSLLRRPRLLLEFLRTRVGRYARATLRYLRRRTRRSGGHPGEPVAAPAQVAVLTHVAVSPEARGAGVGGTLVEGFARRACEAGADEVRLITPSNGPGPGFYRALGWHQLRSRRAADGTVVDVFVLSLSE